MTGLRVWLLRLAGLFRRSTRDRALDAELRAHLADLADDLVDRGLSRAEAEREARRTFGGVDQIKEAYRDQRGWPLFDSLGHDFRMARRLLTTRPGSTALIVAGLGLGIGVSMAFFTIVNAICLRGLPIPRPDRVLFLSTRDKEGAAAGISYPDFLDLRRAATAFDGLAAYDDAPLTLADEDDAPARVAGSYLSAAALPMLGAAPIEGRALLPDDERPGAPVVALLGEAMWRSRYHRDRSIVGRAVRINGVATTIVGVMPDRFRFPIRSDVWLPLPAMPGLADAPRTERSLAVVGRLRDAADPADAQAQLQAIEARLDADYPASHRDVRFESVPINDHFNGNVTDPVWLAFLTAGVLVLLVACANVANVLLARLATRSREVAVRIALGATRARVVRQLLIESLCLAALGGLAGLAFAFCAVRLLAWSYPASAPLPYWVQFTVDARVLAVLVATCAASVLIFGLVPALQSARTGVNDVLKDGGRHGTGGRRARFWTATFLAVELALTLVLLANVSMTLRRELVHEAPGIEIDASPLLVAHLTLPPQRYDTAAERRRFYLRLRAEIAAIAHVVSMTASAQVPPGHERRRLVLPEHEPSETDPFAYSTSVGPRFFETLGIAPVAGRDLTAEDEQPGHEGVVVNQRFADLFFPGRQPIGERIALRDLRDAPATPAWRVIVGVMPILRDGDVPLPIAYVPNQADVSSAALWFRTTGDPAATSLALRQAVARLDRDLPLDRVAPLPDALRDANWNGHVSAGILLTITSIAFLLAVVGLYAVTAQSVIQRTPEIGIRMALGASTRAVVWLVLRRAFAYVTFGVAASLPCIYMFERTIVASSTTTHPLLSPLTFAPIVVLLIVVTLAACARPAARAARIAPASALRQE
jgi:predicted permease